MMRRTPLIVLALGVGLACNSSTPAPTEAKAPEPEGGNQAAAVEPGPAVEDESAPAPSEPTNETAPPSEPPTVASASEEVALFFPDAQQGCDEVTENRRTIAIGADRTTAVVTALLEGPTAAELAAGVMNPFAHDPQRHQLAAHELRRYFRRVHVAGGVATLDFDPPAADYLTDQPACWREAVLTSITRTLEALPDVTGVELTIDGEPLPEGGA